MMSSLSKPVLFLDFDRTLFDTEGFYAWLGEDRYAQTLALLSGRRAPPDFSTFLFPETLDFLRTMRAHYRLVLLSYSVNTVMQRRKVRDSGVAPLFDDILIVQCDKGAAATEYLSRFAPTAWRHVFVDDEPGNISDMKSAHPDFLVIQIGAREGDTEHPALTPPDKHVEDLKALLPFITPAGAEKPLSR